MKKIILATSNAGKTHEIQAAFKPLPVEIIPQSTFDLKEADETACTFVENALLKARYAASQSGLPAIADDSGLMVDALNNAPGVYSARYAGPEANPQRNIEKLLTQLKDVPFEKRTAQFYCVLVYLEHAKDPCPIICEGFWKGSILFEPQGTNGFGYDPIFYVPSEDCTAAELSFELKNRLSHRGQALREMVKMFA
jgi:XTP/dITP diphosphohydrolase